MASTLHKSFLDPVMPASRRANQCIQEVEGDIVQAEMLDTATGSFREDPMPDAAKGGISKATESFKLLVDEIESALHAGSEDVRTMRRGEVFNEHVAPRGLRHYRIPLPSRPTEVTLSVSRNS